MCETKGQWRSFVYYGEHSNRYTYLYVCQTAHTAIKVNFLCEKFKFFLPVLQQKFRRSSSNPRSMEYSMKHTAHFNTRRNTLCAAKSQRMHHEQTDSYHGLFIIRKSVLQAALAQPARYYRLPPLYELTPFVPTNLPSL